MPDPGGNAELLLANSTSGTRSGHWAAAYCQRARRRWGANVDEYTGWDADALAGSGAAEGRADAERRTKRSVQACIYGAGGLATLRVQPPPRDRAKSGWGKVRASRRGVLVSSRGTRRDYTSTLESQIIRTGRRLRAKPEDLLTEPLKPCPPFKQSIRSSHQCKLRQHAVSLGAGYPSWTNPCHLRAMV